MSGWGKFRAGWLALLSLVLLAACTGYRAVGPGPVSIGALSVQPASPWNKAPIKFAGREFWTREGVYLDHIIFIDGLPDGKPLFVVDKRAEFGLFRAHMLPSDVMELTESSLAKLYGSALIETRNLRPAPFGNKPGFRFDYGYVSALDVPMKGLAAGAIIDGRLYLILYEAAETHYFEAGLPEVEALIRSAAIT